MIYYFNFKRATDNGIISRKQLIWHLKAYGYTRETTIDCYRNYLHRAGYLNTVARGKYIVEKRIPSHLPIELCKEQAYGNVKQKIIAQVPFGDDLKDFKHKPNDFIKESEMEI